MSANLLDSKFNFKSFLIGSLFFCIGIVAVGLYARVTVKKTTVVILETPAPPAITEE